MGVKISGVYNGGLSMKMTHDLSKSQVLTDPPLDNGGEGLSFSPTDLIATGLASCMMSVMALYAKKQKIDLKGMCCTVEKHMSVDLPRRISNLDVVIKMPRSLCEADRQQLEQIANTCPVIQSLHSQIQIHKQYIYEV